MSAESNADAQNTTTEGVDTPEDGSGPENGSQAVSESNPSREAARYRTRLRETEAERDDYAARLATLQRAEIERLASAGLSQPNDLFALSGNDLSAYLTDDGTVDAAKVSADVASILKQRPGLGRRHAPTDPSQGIGGGGRAPLSWEALLAD